MSRTPKPMAEKYGKLTVEGVVGRTPSGEFRYGCVCDCGTSKICNGANLRSGKTTSCGCHLKEITRARSLKHGMAGSAEYTSWLHMKERRGKTTDPDFQHYGGRGIKVCAEWQSSFESFLAHAGRKPTPGMTIDRIDVNGNYEPGNIRWATATTQARNKRTSNSLGRNGVYREGNSFRAFINITPGRKTRLGSFDNLFDAVAARISAENRYWTESSNLS